MVLPETLRHHPDLRAVLVEARDQGFLGPGEIDQHVLQAESFGPSLRQCEPRRVLDLGSGGGLPGLVLALSMPDSQWVLLDAGLRRTQFLTAACLSLGMEGRISVVRARAEEAGHRSDMRGHFDAVVARSFGPPPVVAECGAPFLRVGGRLLVADTPENKEDRWPEEELARLGLTAQGRSSHNGFHIKELLQTSVCPDEFPRRNGQPSKRPLYFVSRETP